MGGNKGRGEGMMEGVKSRWLCVMTNQIKTWYNSWLSHVAQNNRVYSLHRWIV